MNAKAKWVIDPAHSEILFKVKHLMITNVKGEFRKFDGMAVTDGDNFSKGNVHVSIDASSVFTNNDGRDNHLKGADFFDVEKYPKITFESTEMKQLDDENFQLKGVLTMKGVSKEITLEVEHGGLAIDGYGNEKAGFSVSGKFNRKDWGLNWNAPLEAGGVMVSEEVRLSAEVQFTKQVAEVEVA